MRTWERVMMISVYDKRATMGERKREEELEQQL